MRTIRLARSVNRDGFGFRQRSILQSRAIVVLLAIGSTLTGCRLLQSPLQRDIVRLPRQHELQRDQLIFHTDFTMPKKHRLLDELALKRTIIANKLAVPTSDEPIHVFLFRDQARFHRFLRWRFPLLPRRRALFLKDDASLNVYTYWSSDVARDLSHEVTHGYLHSVMPDVPLWLDEGLAEYFEIPRGKHGFNRPHVLLLSQRFRAGDWQPDLRRLESVSDPGKLTQLNYAEAWLWTHFLLEGSETGQQLVKSQLASLHNTGEAPRLSDQIGEKIPASDEALLRHLHGLAKNLEPVQ